ncbi:hypothetical protein V9T40_009429 [Parthenolecanium corni]|uniref:Large ribosomal subunit protein uL4m n=1 Tax=Parthenolecanium corni TaxID=536013 RepID=A0AAN9U118_9HEMI
MSLLSRTGTPLLSFTRSLRFFKSKTDKTLNVASASPTGSQSNETSVENTKSVIAPRILDRVPPFMIPRQVWLENFNTMETNRIGIVDLHPEVFGARPKLHLIYENLKWQVKYRQVNFAYMPAKHEIPRSTRKPWPQKGTGRARHGTRRSPLFIGGVKIHGPKGPETHFYMLPHAKRVAGLCCTLSVKLAQDDLHIIDNLDIPTNDPQYILDLIKTRKWGPSVLIVDIMLKYNTLVLTLAAAEKIEEKLLKQLYSPAPHPGKLFVSSV